eukprot:787065-Rhodomonas_salina.2
MRESCRREAACAEGDARGAEEDRGAAEDKEPIVPLCLHHLKLLQAPHTQRQRCRGACGHVPSRLLCLPKSAVAHSECSMQHLSDRVCVQHKIVGAAHGPQRTCIAGMPWLQTLFYRGSFLAHDHDRHKDATHLVRNDTS